MQTESIITKTHELLKEGILLLRRFPRDFKFNLGDRIQTRMADTLELYIKAYYSAPKQKRELLQQANINLSILRHYFRLSFELGLYPSSKYEEMAKRLNEIGRMTGGWLKNLPPE